MFDEFEEDPRPDLTPLIDVIFMLVIFFVMTMSFSKPVLDVMLPKSDTAERQKRGADLELAVHQDGTVWNRGREITAEDLPTFLESEPESLLNLFIDEKAPFESFIKIVDLAKTKRGGKFVISTKMPGEK